MRLSILILAGALALSSCSSGSSASSCTAYAAEVRALIDGGASGDEIERFLETTEEHVAKLIMNDPERGEPCAEAVLEAVFTAGFADFEAEF